MFEHLFVVVDWWHGAFLSVDGGDSRQWTQIARSVVSYNLVVICHVLCDFHDWQTNYLFARVVMFCWLHYFSSSQLQPSSDRTLLFTCLCYLASTECCWCVWSSLQHIEHTVSTLFVFFKPQSQSQSVHTMAGCERWWCFCLFCIAWLLLKYDCTLLMF